MNSLVCAEVRDLPARTAICVEHVRLAYYYRDRLDLEGYASLLHEQVVDSAPGEEPRRGRPALLRRIAEWDRPATCHLIDRILVDGNTIVVVGRVRGELGPHYMSFVDIIELSGDCLLTRLSRYRADVPATPGRPFDIPNFPTTN
ncbi:nuclear transport factor 2 family protein [Amycolatopsis sp. GM8]|uniref:nuclear transport factor 2 family protein n=1 Tax=Amycolatopsis sp. GM8 TaxID=2896530 RepID=UPI001F24A178|nr:nuclear transport factor 2 family protein [Amycolatopsis sp. GM8]